MAEMLLAVLVGVGVGILTAFGLGGGTLLLLYLTAVLCLPQQQAQSINLLYFLPTALLALPSHQKQGYLAPALARPALLTGLCFALLGAWLSNHLDSGQLRQVYGGFLLLLGTWELFKQ